VATKISATKLARNLGDILARVRYKRETFIVEKNRLPVAKISPVARRGRGTLGEVVRAWHSVKADPDFARDLESVGAADTPAELPWGS
jgi:antitoxin (DNA-binding transcriptional repressor) of toxin-antitoxin stability system